MAVSPAQRAPPSALRKAAVPVVPAVQPGVRRWQRRGVQRRIQALGEGGGAAPRGGAVEDLPGGRRGRGVPGGLAVVQRVYSGGGAHGLAGTADHDLLLGGFGVVDEGADGEILRVGVRFLFGGHTAGAAEPETRPGDVPSN